MIAERGRLHDPLAARPSGKRGKKALPDGRASDVQFPTYRLSLSAPGDGFCPTVARASARKSVATFCTASSTARCVAVHFSSAVPVGQGGDDTSMYAFAF